MKLFILACCVAFWLGLLSLTTGCAWNLRGSITAIKAEEFVQKGASDQVFDWLFNAKSQEKKS